MNKKIKGSKNLNVPNKGEQSQTCLGSAERKEHLHKENVPNLRFPEFSGEWEKTSIGKILTIGNGRDYKHLTEGNIPVFGTGGYMLSVNEYLYDGESVFIGRKGTINKPFFFSGKFWTVDTLFYTHKFVDVLPYFVYGLFQRINWNNYNEASGVPSLSKSTIEKISINVPIVEEQRKIANLMSLLDDRIATQIKIIEDLKKLKSAISKTIFTGNKFECHQTTLGDVADIYQPQTIPTSWLCEENEYNVYGANGIIGKYSKYNHETSQICIACRGNSCGAVNYSTPKSWITGNAMVINTDGKDVDKRYLYHLLCTINFTPLISGSGQPQIVRSPLEKMKIRLPNLPIQRNISKVLDDIESKIEIEEEICKQFMKQKSGLLSQMFI